MGHRAWIVLAVAAAAGGAACGGAQTSAGGASANACDLPLGEADEGSGALVVLLDGSESIETQQGRVDELVALLDTATADAELEVSFASFGGSDAEVRFSPCFDGTAFVARGNNARTRERNRPALLEAATAELAALPVGHETSDPTAALRAAVDRLEGVEGERTVVVHTDGIPTAGCAALPEQTNVSDPALVDQLVGACTAEGQLPDADGIEIVVGGIGRTDEDLSAESVTFLIELNTALCTATGATCRVDPNLPPSI